MEGGSDNDLRILEQPTEEEEERERAAAGGPGAEALKREEPKAGNVDRKLAGDKEDKEKVGVALEDGGGFTAMALERRHEMGVSVQLKNGNLCLSLRARAGQEAPRKSRKA